MRPGSWISVKLPKDWISEHASASVGQLTWPERRNMKETKKQILIRLNKNTDLIKKEERKNKDSATRHLANLLNGTSGKKLFRG